MTSNEMDEIKTPTQSLSQADSRLNVLVCGPAPLIAAAHNASLRHFPTVLLHTYGLCNSVSLCLSLSLFFAALMCTCRCLCVRIFFFE